MILAHISDLHVRAPLGPWTGLLGKRLLGALNLLKRAHPDEILDGCIDDLRREAPDHLAVTGDLTNLLLESELAKAAAAIARAGLPPERLSIIPGNHDAYVPGPHRARRFEHHMGPLLGEPALAWPRAQRHGDALVVSLSSAVPTPWFTAFGRVGRQQLEQARALLAQDAAFKALLVHHPPVQGDGRPDRVWRRNLDGAEVISLCQDAGVGLILCGHTHRAFRRWVGEGARRLLVSCAGSTTKAPKALGQAATYERYSIQDGRLVGIETRGWDPAARRFVPVRTTVP